MYNSKAVISISTVDPKWHIVYVFQDCAARLGQEFIQKLASLGEKMLLEFDQLLTIDDVEKGRKFEYIS